MKTISPPPQTLLAACDEIDKTLVAFIAARGELRPSSFESDQEALNLFNLVIRHVEGVLLLARTDLVLIPPAYAAARAAFETAIRAAWLVDATDPFDREARYLAHLKEDESAHKRAADRSIDGISTNFLQASETIRVFREGITSQMPGHVVIPKAVPKLTEMCNLLGGEHLYTLYIYLSQFAHGGHIATSLYRQNLGTMRVEGEFIGTGNWYIALRLCWLSLCHPGNIVLTRIANKPVNFLSSEQEKFVTDAIEATKVHA